MRQVSIQALRIFGSVRKKRTLSSLSKNKRILHYHILSQFTATNIQNNFATNKLITKKILTKKLLTAQTYYT